MFSERARARETKRRKERREQSKKSASAQRQLSDFMYENSINPMSARTSFCVAYATSTFSTIFFVSARAAIAVL